MNSFWDLLVYDVGLGFEKFYLAFLNFSSLLKISTPSPNFF